MTFKPVTIGDVVGNFNALLNIYREHPLRPVVECPMIVLNLSGVFEEDSSYYPGLVWAPASYNRHHSYPGGLVVHYREMISLATLLLDKLPKHETLNETNVLSVILLHDLHKAWKNYICHERDQECTYEYNKDPSRNAFDKNTISLQLAESALRWAGSNYKIPLPVIHAIMNSEGGYGTTKTREVSALAKFCYVLDELSANVMDPIMREPEKQAIFNLF